LGQNRRDQYCQVLTELGDLYFHSEMYLYVLLISNVNISL